MTKKIERWKELHNEQARLIYELRKKIRDEKQTQSLRHIAECENMLYELLKQNVNNEKEIISNTN